MSYRFQVADAVEFARFIGADVHEKGNEIFFRKCPYCDGGGNDKDTFSINMDSGAFNCFRSSCGKKGHFIELARDFDFKVDDGSPKKYRELPQKQVVVRDEALAYMRGRGISEEVSKRYHITTQIGKPNIIVFPFYDQDGVLRSVKYRKANFDKSKDKNKEWFESDTMPLLFGMDQCSGFDRLVITEGQIDALSLIEAGIPNAVSVPTGARGFTWLENCRNWVNNFQEIVVFGDNEKGHITLADDLMSKVQSKIRIVRQVDYLGEKDANDILRKYGKEPLIAAVNNAEVPKLSNVKMLSDVKSVDLNKLDRIRTNIRELDKVIGGLIYGQLVLLTGERGHGKSTFMSQLICEALDQNESVFIYSGELADFHFKAWLDSQLAGLEHMTAESDIYGNISGYRVNEDAQEAINVWYRDKAYIYDNSYIDTDNEQETILETVENVIRQYGTRLICIDNLMAAMDCSANENLYQAQSTFVGKLKRLAMRYNVCIILVAHPRKMNKDGFTNDSVSGSGDITNKVDVALLFKRLDDGACSVEVTKNRLFGKYGSANLHYFSNSRRIVPADTEKHYGWQKLLNNNHPAELPF